MKPDVFHRFRFPFEEVRPRREEIHSFLRSDYAPVGDPVNEAIGKIMPQLVDNEGIAGGYILRRAGETRLDTGSQIRSYLKGADYLALFVCTAGALFTDLANGYQRAGDYLEAFVADAIGSLTVEKAMDRIQGQLERETQAGDWHISNRYSPGYCNWPLAGQRELFEQMGNPSLPVSLTESCLMLPIKSISGVIAVGAQVRKRPYACRICKNRDCIYRKLIQ
jgi:hypothetical protein